jgi:hypothetical protein
MSTLSEHRGNMYARGEYAQRLGTSNTWRMLRCVESQLPSASNA